MNIMQEVNINTLVNEKHILNENIPNHIIIIGNIDRLNIKYMYNQLDLSKVVCNSIQYDDQEGESIKNHKLSNSLEYLWCFNNKLISLPDLPDSLEYLDCSYNKLTSLPDLSDSLQKLFCDNNKLISLPDLPDSLKYLYCSNNKLTLLPDLPKLLIELFCSNNNLTSLPDLPNSLQKLFCSDNKLTSLPDLPNIDRKFKINLHQDLPIEYIHYNTNLKLFKLNNKINIIDYPHNPITNQKELDKYMDYIKNYQLNRIKSARN